VVWWVLMIAAVFIPLMLQVMLQGPGIMSALVGKNSANYITTSYATGAVEGVNYVGGLAGNNDGDGGGMTNSYATGKVTGTGTMSEVW